MSGLAKVVAYEPADMTVTVEAGLNLGALNRTMESARQRLPVDAPNPDATSVGALIAASHAGPLRLSEGTVRDLLIGIRYIGREGRIVHGGGRVVKNVAGYDLMKVMTGSYGTLGIITEATFKVRPIPEHYAIATADFDLAEDAFTVARQLNDSFALAHLEVLSPGAARSCGMPAKFVLMAGFSGSGPEMPSQRDSISRTISRALFLEDDGARDAYARVRDFDITTWPLVAQVATPPAETAPLLASWGVEFIAHAGSGVATVFVSGSSANPAETITRWRESARRVRGHVRILHCDQSQRAGIDFFDRPNDGALALMRRTKIAFDPAGVFNPGCFVGGL